MTTKTADSLKSKCLPERLDLTYAVRIALIVVAVCLLLPYGAMAVPAMKFKRVDVHDGLSNSLVNCIFKDSRGYLWVGTRYGLNRYDGFRFKVYHSNTQDSTALRYDYVNGIYETADGRLLIEQGTNYCFYNPRTERFDYDMKSWLNKLGVEGNVEKCYVDAAKHVWIKVYGGDMFCVGPDGKKILRFPFTEDVRGFARGTLVSSFSECGRSVMAVTDHGQIVCMDRRTGRVAWQSDYVARFLKNEAKNVMLKVDPHGNYWVLVNGHVWVYVRKARRWANSLSRYFRMEGMEAVPPTLLVWDVAFAPGQVWMATDHDGLYVAHLDERSLRQYVNDKADEASLSDMTVTTIYRTREGHFWLGTYKKGLDLCVPNTMRVENLRLGNVNTIAEDRQGNYWLGTNDRGLVCYDPRLQSARSYTEENSGLQSNVIVSSLCAADGTLWFGTYNGGLSHYQNGIITTYRHGSASLPIASDNVWALAEDSTHHLWIGTLGAGVQRIDRKTGAVSTFDNKTSMLTSDYVSSLQLSRKGWIVVGTSDNYALIHPDDNKIVNMQMNQDASRHTVMNTATSQVFIDSRELVWYASASGVNVFDGKTGDVTLLDSKSGLSGDNTCAVAEDGQRNIWVVSEYGISCVHPYQEGGRWRFSIRNYTASDGFLPGPYNQRSICLTHDGRVLIGCYNGVNVFDPRQLGRKEHFGKPLFSGLRIFGRDIDVGDEFDGRVILTEAINEQRELRLRHTDNQFTILLATDQGIVSDGNCFAYRIEGISEQWLKTDANNPSITITGLAPGCYTLVVKMYDEQNRLQEAESRLVIHVAPPFYQSLWAYTFYILMMVAAALYWRRHERKKLRLERMKMERRMEMENERRQKDLKNDLLNSMSDEMKDNLEQTFMAMDQLMAEENDEERYEREQDVRKRLEGIVGQINEQISRKAKKELIVPKIKEVEVTSLDEQLVNDATAYVEDNMANSDITVETMSEALNMSRVHLYKRLTSVTGSTPSEFIRNIRLRHAEQLLRKSQLTVSEVSYRVGFNNPRYFTKYFKDKYGVIPSQYKAEADKTKNGE